MPDGATICGVPSSVMPMNPIFLPWNLRIV